MVNEEGGIPWQWQWQWQWSWFRGGGKVYLRIGIRFIIVGYN